jgi:NAD(P)H dehydrogenase (quinone)
MIVVTGATGQLGSQVVQRLLERVPADQVGVSVRDPARAADLAARGVRVRHGDFGDPDTLDAAFESATQVLVVSVDSLGEAAVAQHRTAVDAALRAGAQRVVYTSHQAASPDSLFGPARDHAATEAYLAQAGVAHTALRDGFHAATVPHLLGRARETGELVAPADGPVSWTTHADLAAGAAAVLTDPDRPAAETPVLTAAEAVDLAHVAEVLSELVGRTVRRVVVDDEDYVAGLVGHGVPEPAAQMFLTLFQAARRGEFAVTSPTLAVLLGREPQSVRTVLQAAGAAR